MKRTLASLALSTAVLAVVPQTSLLAADEAPATQPAGKQSDVPVKAVVLFSSGVGYFEHYGTVTGNGSTELRFKTQQINDILKSLVLQDMEGGKVSTITYPSQDPIAKTLKSFQVDITNNPPLGDLLNQLRGAQLTITKTDATKITGIVLGVEKKQRAGSDDKKPSVEVSVLNVLSGSLIRSIEIDQLADIQLDDAGLRDELNKALAALGQARDQGKKPVTINFAGVGERHVRIGYVVETPVWKTSYRLILAAGAQDKPKLQGWAIVENQTDSDWNGVQLSLISGRPISFVQDLYQPLYIPRPVVQPELYASLNPQTYEGGIAGKKANAPMQMAARNRRAGEMEAAAVPAAPPGANFFGGGGGGGCVSDLAEKPIDVTSSLASVASAGNIG